MPRNVSRGDGLPRSSSKKDLLPKYGHPKKDVLPRCKYQKDHSPRSSLRKNLWPRSSNTRNDLLPRSGNTRKDASPRSIYKKNVMPRKARSSSPAKDHLPKTTFIIEDLFHYADAKARTNPATKLRDKAHPGKMQTLTDPNTVAQWAAKSPYNDSSLKGLSKDLHTLLLENDTKDEKDPSQTIEDNTVHKRAGKLEYPRALLVNTRCKASQKGLPLHLWATGKLAT